MLIITTYLGKRFPCKSSLKTDAREDVMREVFLLQSSLRVLV